MTPNLAIVHVATPNSRGIRLWLPLFLLWIPFLLLAPLVLLIVLVACLACRIPFWRTLATFWALGCSLPGTDVRVCADGKRITVRVL